MLKKILSISLILSILCSCSVEQRAYRRFIKLAEKYPKFITQEFRIDTVIREKEVLVPIPATSDTNVMVRPDVEKDTFFVQHEKGTTIVYKDRIVEVEKEVPVIKWLYKFINNTPPDTIKITVRDSIPESTIITNIEAPKRNINWWLILAAFIIGIILSRLLKK